MATRFALRPLDIFMPDGVVITLWFDSNSKVTRDNGTLEEPAANAFSLAHIKDCPFATETCKSVCYVNKLEQHEAEVYAKYLLNSEVIRRILENPDYLTAAIMAVAGYINENCRGGFRWHVSGDIFSMSYACFIRDVCLFSEGVSHWIYTRSFEYIMPLICAKNLVINLSVDEDNWAQAAKFAHDYKLRPCYLTLDGKVPAELPDNSVIFPSYELRARDSIQSDKFRCGVCKKCLKPFRP